jgi:hypothetical protein
MSSDPDQPTETSRSFTRTAGNGQNQAAHAGQEPSAAGVMRSGSWVKDGEEVANRICVDSSQFARKAARQRSKSMDSKQIYPATQIKRRKRRSLSRARRETAETREWWWSRGESNPWPRHCERRALPTELLPRTLIRERAMCHRALRLSIARAHHRPLSRMEEPHGRGGRLAACYFVTSVQMRLYNSVTSGGQARENLPLPCAKSGTLISGASFMSAGMKGSDPLMPLP